MRIYNGLALIAPIWAACIGAASANTYSALANFSITTNPAGPWSYLDQKGLLNVRNNAYESIEGYRVWLNGQPICSKSEISRNKTKSTIFVDSTVVFPTDHLRLDPETNAFETVRFEAPANGIYVIRGDFLGIDTNEMSHPVAILNNGVSVFAGTVAKFAQSAPYKLKLTLAAGDHVDFVVQSSGCSNLSTGLAAVIIGP